MAVNPWERQYGSTEALGATWIEADQAWNFALYSKFATAVTLCVYGTDPGRPCFTLAFDPLLNRTGRVWHARVPAGDLQGGTAYGYRIDGPQPAPGFGFDWQEFHPDKVLLDPYARAVHFPPGFSRAAACLPGSNEGKAPLGRLVPGDDPFDWGGDQPRRHGQALVIYELHVGQFTRSPGSGLSAPEFRGTYRGVIEKIPHLLELGVTAVELMPVFQFDPQEGSCWGYMTLNFFAPHQGYAVSPDARGQKDEFRGMVKALHAAGLEVLLDVVFNHTTEGDRNGPVYSFKGIDCSSYYMINRDDSASPYDNRSQCGNTLLAQGAAVRRLVLDSLRYWVQEMHVDGFRFDLASVLAFDETTGTYQEEAPLFDEIALDPVLNGVRLIAEQWDMEAGRFPGRVWHQWNGAYRDCLRRFVRGDAGLVGELMTRIYGSCDRFPDDLRHAMHPWQSVNYLASHDGFRLADVVSYSAPLDQPGDENSWDCGFPGVEGAPAEVVALRKRQVKHFCALLMLSNGIPMLAMGDEIMHGQQGRRNPYDLDSPVTWLDWDLRVSNADVFDFHRRMIAFRKAHPALASYGYWREAVRWHGADGPCDLSGGGRTLAFFLDGRAAGDDDLYVMSNGHWEATRFRIQEEGPPAAWTRALDTGVPAPGEFTAGPGLDAGGWYELGGRSLAVFLRRRS